MKLRDLKEAYGDLPSVKTKFSIQETYNFFVRFETHLKISDLMLKNIISQFKPEEYDLKKKHNFKQ